jgi:ferrous-iron efflux pump FieF
MPVEPTENEQLSRLIRVTVLTSIPALAFTVWIGLASGSLSVMAVVLDSGVALSLNLASLLGLRIASRSNVFQFPYGTGKLENVTSFLHGCGMVLVGGAVAYRAAVRLAGPPEPVSLGLAQLAFVVGIARMIAIMVWLARIAGRQAERSPLLNAYLVSFRTGLWYSSSVLAAMLVSWWLSRRWGNAVEVLADLLIAAVFSVYLAWSGLRVVRANFRALLDLPLPEEDQMKIMQVLSRHFDDFSGLGNVATRSSGGERRVEIELDFPPETTARRVEELRGQMQEELGEHFKKLELHLIARCRGK